MPAAEQPIRAVFEGGPLAGREVTLPKFVYRYRHATPRPDGQIPTERVPIWTFEYVYVRQLPTGQYLYREQTR